MGVVGVVVGFMGVWGLIEFREIFILQLRDMGIGRMGLMLIISVSFIIIIILLFLELIRMLMVMVVRKKSI